MKLLLLFFSIINLVLVENIKKNNNQKTNQDLFLIIGEAISGISLIFIFIYIVLKIY
jgi:hypothetical protein